LSSIAIEEKNYLTKGNKISFALSGFGQNLMGGLVNSFLLFFYTDIFRIDKGAVAILMIVARIWDAINDPIMGTIVDKTRSRWGKMRPYLLFIFIPLGFSVALLFIMPPGLSMTMKVVYACITFLIWDVVYTICDVPFWGLPSTMTPNPKERVKFISHSRLVHSIGAVLPMALIPLATALFPPETAYTYTAIFVGIAGAALFSLSFFGTKERCVPRDKAPGLKDCLRFLGMNKPLQRVVLANVMGFMRALPIPAGMYIAVYIIKSANITIGGLSINLSGTTLNTVMVAGWGVAGYIGMIVSPSMLKKLNFKQLFIGATIVGALASAVLFIIGASLASIMIALLVAGGAYGIVTNINYIMIAESIDFVEWKTGERTEGVTIAFQTLMNKAMTGLQIGLVSASLIVIKFVQPIESATGEIVTQQQSQFTLNGMFWLASVLPVIGWVLSLIPILNFKFIGKFREDVLSELAQRRAGKKEGELLSNETSVLDMYPTIAPKSLDEIKFKF
jgi:sugar (glycoside-pentoside-hexuronide) transporter